MGEALAGDIGERRAPVVQAGKLLCVSETIFPDGSRHSMNMVYRGIGAGGGLRPSCDVRMAGKEFVDLRELDLTELTRSAGEPITRDCRPGFGGGRACPGGT